MLRKINEALFAAPAGATIQVVVESQGNNGVNDARFEYAGDVLDRENINGLPGCTITVAGSRELLEAGVVFDPAAPAARYDMFEVENGVKRSLDKSVKSSNASPLIEFTIRPDAAILGAAPPPPMIPPPTTRPAAAGAPPAGPSTATRRKAAKKGTKKAAKKKQPKKTKKTTAARKKTAPTKKTRARKATPAKRKTAPKRKTVSKRKTARKRSR